VANTSRKAVFFSKINNKNTDKRPVYPLTALTLSSDLALQMVFQMSWIHWSLLNIWRSKPAMLLYIDMGSCKACAIGSAAAQSGDGAWG